MLIIVLVDKLSNTPEKYAELLNLIDNLPHEDNALILLDDSTWERYPMIHVYHNADKYPSNKSVSIITDICRIFEDRYEIGSEYHTCGVTGFTEIPEEAPTELTVDNCRYSKFGLRFSD